MKRKLLRLAAAALLLPLMPRVGNGQQSPARIFQVGWLQGGYAGDYSPEILEVFRRGLREKGWVEGKNVVFAYRFAEGKADRLAEFAAEMVRLKVDVIVATSPSAIFAAKNATTTIPIVMVYGPDPVKSGLVPSLARPGGNITGLTSLSDDLSVKQLELLLEIAPAISRLGLLWNPTNPWHAASVKRVSTVAVGRGIRLQVIPVSRPDELADAFAAMSKARVNAVLALADPMTLAQRVRLAELAMQHSLPSMNGLTAYTEAGGLASYWPDSAEMFRRAADFVQRILGGARAADLPIEQPTKFEMVVNLKTAKALGLRFPAATLARADRVIE